MESAPHSIAAPSCSAEPHRVYNIRQLHSGSKLEDIQCFRVMEPRKGQADPVVF